MSAVPLGSRYVRPSRKAKRITLKPPSSEYHVNVSIPPHVADEEEPGLSSASAMSDSSFATSRMSFGQSTMAGSAFSYASSAQRGLGADYADSAVNAVVVHLQTSDTVAEAIVKVLARYKEATDRELPRGPSAYMLCRCFADFSIDFSLRGLHGDSDCPMVEHLEFPYFLSLQVIPWQQRRDALQFEHEPDRRQELREGRRTFVLFALEYAAMLRRMHQQYVFLLGRDADARRQKKDLELRARQDVQMRIAFSSERSQRAAIETLEDYEWQTTSFTVMALLQHSSVLREQLRYSTRELSAAHRRLMASLASESRIKVLENRYARLIGELIPREIERALGHRRELYTEARIASGIQTANATGTDVDIANMRRVQVAAKRQPKLFEAPNVVNSDEVLGDVFTCSRSLVSDITGLR